jgi:hypothetical protein
VVLLYEPLVAAFDDCQLVEKLGDGGPEIFNFTDESLVGA